MVRAGFFFFNFSYSTVSVPCVYNAANIQLLKIDAGMSYLKFLLNFFNVIMKNTRSMSYYLELLQ